MLLPSSLRIVIHAAVVLVAASAFVLLFDLSLSVTGYYMRLLGVVILAQSAVAAAAAWRGAPLVVVCFSLVPVAGCMVYGSWLGHARRRLALVRPKKGRVVGVRTAIRVESATVFGRSRIIVPSERLTVARAWGLVAGKLAVKDSAGRRYVLSRSSLRDAEPS